MEYRVLALGDVASETGLTLLEKKLRAFKREQRIDFTVVNGENISGTGLTRAQAEELLAAGAYTEPDNIDDMTDAEREQKAEAFEKAVAAVAERERLAEKRKWRILLCVLGLLGFAALLLQGIATSIDALSVGFTIAEYDLIHAIVAGLIIATVTLIICLCGIALGRRFGTALAGKASILGGGNLICVGIEIFISGIVR